MNQKYSKYIHLFFVGVALIIFSRIFDMKILRSIISAFYPVIIGAVLAYLISPLVYSLESRLPAIKHRHGIATILTFLALVILVIIIMIYLTPVIIRSASAMLNNINQYVSDFELTVNQVIRNKQFAAIIIEAERSLLSSLGKINTLSNFPVFEYLRNAGSGVLTGLLGVIFCPYIIIEIDRLAAICDRFLLIFISKKHLAYVHYYIKTSNKIFGDFLYGKFIDSLIIGIIALIGLAILKIKFFPVLAFIVFLTNMIPYFGPFIGAVPVVIVAFLTGGYIPAFMSAVFILILQQFDGLILGPKVLGDTVGISPFWIILAITVFGNFFGVVGMLIGVPIICIFRVLFRDLKNYQDKGITPLEIED